MKIISFLLAFFTTFLFLFTNTSYAKSGCCSWHDGVCGCSGGRQLCCDGTLSPSCTCYSAPIQTIAPIKAVPTFVSTPKPRVITTIAPTSTPKIIPTITSNPEVKDESTSNLGEGILGIGTFSTVAYFGLKFLAKITAPKEK